LEQIAAYGGSPDPGAAATGLINEFGSLPAALAGSSRRLKQAAKGDVAALQGLQDFRNALQHCLLVPLTRRPILSNWQGLLDYLYTEMAYRKIECFRVLHLNSRNMLIRDEVMSEGSIDQASVHVREVVHRALDLGSSSIILVHNHPSGDPSASRADIDITRAIAEASRRLGLAVHDHLIIGAHGHVSLRSEGLF
jgi:DNA repair protein RadC